MNKIGSRSTLLLSALLMYGCATAVPTGPSIMVMPGPDKPFEEFQRDDYTCRQWAQSQIGYSTQDTINQNAQLGAVTGALIGAAAGAVIGSASGDAGAGAAIGAGTGLVAGVASGASQGQVYGAEAQRRYDIAYAQCMYSKGNQVGNTVTTRSRSKRYPPPPPPGYRNPPPVYEEDDGVPPDYRPTPPPPMQRD